MSLWSRLTRSEKRSETAPALKASDPYLAEYFGGRGVSGFTSPDDAARLSVAQACIRLVAETLSSVPLKLRRFGEMGGSVSAIDHPLYAVLQENFNDGLTAFAAREWMIAELLIHGNAFCRIEWNGHGQVVGLYPQAAKTVGVERLKSGRLRYRINGQVFLSEEILHVRHRTTDGILGLSPITTARETFGLALTQREQAIVQTAKGFSAGGALVFPDSMTDEQHAVTSKDVQSNFHGTMNTGRVLVIDGGAKFEKFSLSSVDAEFLASRKLSNLDVARIYGVPPSAVGITDDATYSNIGEESRALVVRCLAPLAKRIEQQMNAALLSAETRKTLFIQHDLQGLLRGDMTARYESYRVGREGEWLSVNDIRDLEDMGRIEGGDDYTSPSHRAAAPKTADQAE